MGADNLSKEGNTNAQTELPLLFLMNSQVASHYLFKYLELEDIQNIEIVSKAGNKFVKDNYYQHAPIFWEREFKSKYPKIPESFYSLCKPPVDIDYELLYKIFKNLTYNEVEKFSREKTLIWSFFYAFIYDVLKNNQEKINDTLEVFGEEYIEAVSEYIGSYKLEKNEFAALLLSKLKVLKESKKDLITQTKIRYEFLSIESEKKLKGLISYLQNAGAIEVDKNILLDLISFIDIDSLNEKFKQEDIFEFLKFLYFLKTEQHLPQIKQLYLYKEKKMVTFLEFLKTSESVLHVTQTEKEKLFFKKLFEFLNKIEENPLRLLKLAVILNQPEYVKIIASEMKFSKALENLDELGNDDPLIMAIKLKRNAVLKEILSENSFFSCFKNFNLDSYLRKAIVENNIFAFEELIKTKEFISFEKNNYENLSELILFSFDKRMYTAFHKMVENFKDNENLKLFLQDLLVKKLSEVNDKKYAEEDIKNILITGIISPNYIKENLNKFFTAFSENKKLSRAILEMFLAYIKTADFSEKNSSSLTWKICYVFQEDEFILHKKNVSNGMDENIIFKTREELRAFLQTVKEKNKKNFLNLIIASESDSEVLKEVLTFWHFAEQEEKVEPQKSPGDFLKDFRKIYSYFFKRHVEDNFTVDFSHVSSLDLAILQYYLILSEIHPNRALEQDAFQRICLLFAFGFTPLLDWNSILRKIDPEKYESGYIPFKMMAILNLKPYVNYLHEKFDLSPVAQIHQAVICLENAISVKSNNLSVVKHWLSDFRKEIEKATNLEEIKKYFQEIELMCFESAVKGQDLTGNKQLIEPILTKDEKYIFLSFLRFVEGVILSGYLDLYYQSQYSSKIAGMTL